jgi:hypothetical protein
MAEIEVGTESEYKSDHRARRVGLMAAVTAAFLAAVTISSHRAHTAAIIAKTEASDQWAYYQAKKLREANAALGKELGTLITARPPGAAELIEDYKQAEVRYEHEAREIEARAETHERESVRYESRALRFDIGEGLLELGLVLCSLFFIARRNIFPVVAAFAGLLGLAIAAAGLFV